jgi:hypothetical protein
LGATIGEDGKMNEDLINRTSNAGKLYYAINRGFINKKEVNKKNKIAVYKAIYIPTLTYSCESWTLLDTHRSKIQASEMRFLRRVEKVTKRDRIRNQVIREQLQVEPLQERIERTTAGGTITGAY